jgi:predicted aldo/keto reductase-like oxidoreductase
VLYRRFGRTDIDMSVLSCGGMRAQQTWTRGARVSAASQANVDAVVARALALGINHFETARGYGTSEVQFGKALARHPRSAFVLQTKLRPHDDPGTFEAQLEESFALLGVDTIDLLSLHGLNSPNCVELTQRAGGCWEVADRFRRAGRIRHIGFSTHAPTRLIVDIIRSNRFDYVNLHAYYFFQDNLPAIAAARERDMGVFVISPTDKGGRLYAATDRLRALTAPLSPMAFNDLWCLSQMDVHTLSLGAATASDFDAHVDALALLERAPALLPPIVERLETAYADALGADFARRWSHGLPEWDALPGKINVRRILWLHNLVRAYGLIHFAQERYISMSPDNHWVPGARAVDFNDAEMTAALPDSPFRTEIPQLLRRAHETLYNPTVKPRP